MDGGSGQGGGGGGETPQATRTRISLMKALGTEKQIKSGEFVWVMFGDAIARVKLTYNWTVSRRGPQFLFLLSPISEARPESTKTDLFVFTRDGILALQKDGRGIPGAVSNGTPGTIDVGPDIITGEFVEPADDPKRERSYIDIVRIPR